MSVYKEKAERYIFLEYFIVDNGIMWDSILEILIEKVKQGVDVRMMYDDAGCVYTLPANQLFDVRRKIANRIRDGFCSKGNQRPLHVLRLFSV